MKSISFLGFRFDSALNRIFRASLSKQPFLLRAAWAICLGLFCLSSASLHAGFTVQVVNPFPALQFGNRIITADFNNDGKLDILYQAGNTSGAGFSLQVGNGDGTFQPPINKPSGSAFTNWPLTGVNFTQLTSGVVPVDLNWDGKVDHRVKLLLE
jgi:hypothetical protein